MQNIPTLVQIVDSIIANIEAQLNIAIPTNSKAFLRALANTEGAELKLLYLALGYIQMNMAPDLAQSESVGGMLERYGRIRLGRNPFGATAGSYNVQVSGTIGTTINGQITFMSDDTSESPGNLCILDNPFTLVTGTDIITLRSLTAGTSAALKIGDTLTATSPIPLVDSSVVVTGISVQPLDAEELEAYRSTMLKTYKLTPQGGAMTDYRLWAQDAQGVAAIYPYTRSGYSNQINLYIESILSDSTDGKGTPSAGMISNVESVINFNPDTTIPVLQRGRKPATVIVNYFAVTPTQVDITIPSFIGLTVDIQNLINSAITAYVSAIRPFIAAADVNENKNDVLDINGITSVIVSVAPGSSFGTVGLKINGVSMISYQFIGGNIPWINSISYL